MKFHVDVYYRFKKRKAGVCLGQEIEANNEDDAIEEAKATCLGSRWPSRIYAGCAVEEIRN